MSGEAHADAQGALNGGAPCADALDRTSLDVAVIARGDLLHDSRVQKEVRSLGDSGARVGAVGIATARCAAGRGDEPWGTVIRVETRVRPPKQTDRGAAIGRAAQAHTAAASASAPAASAQAAPPPAPAPTPEPAPALATRSPYAGLVGDLRHWAGRMRENALVARAAEPLRPRVVVACDLSMLYAGYLLKRRCGARLIYDAHELWVDSHSGASRFFRWLYTATERRLIRSADAVMTVNDALADELVRRYRIARPLVVMNGPDRCLESTSAGGPLRTLFQGQFGANRGLYELVRALAETGDAVALTLQGFGGIEAELHSLVRDLGLEHRVAFAPPCDPAETVVAAARHDVGVIGYRPTTTNLALSSPVKLFDYLGAGLAILSTDLPVIRQIAGEEAATYLSEPDAASLAAALRELAADPERVSRMKAASHARCADMLWDVQARPLVELVCGWLAREREA